MDCRLYVLVVGLVAFMVFGMLTYELGHCYYNGQPFPEENPGCGDSAGGESGEELKATIDRASCTGVAADRNGDQSPTQATQICTKALGCDQNERLYTPEGHHYDAAAALLEEGTLPLTKEAQRFIYQHQHRTPEECAKATYLLHKTSFGVGAQMQRAASVMAYALTHNMIFQWADSAGDVYANNTSLCHQKNWLCFLQSPSNCSVQLYAHRNNTITLEKPAEWTVAPPKLLQLLKATAPSMSSLTMSMWWKAQSIGYLMRFNAETLQRIVALRKPPTWCRSPLARIVCTW